MADIMKRDESLNYRFIILVLVAMLSQVMLQITDSTMFKISDDFVFLLLLIDSLVAVKKKRIEIGFDRITLVAVSVLCFSYIFSVVLALLNGNQIMVIVLQLRQYKYVFVFLILLYYHGDRVFYQMYNIVRIIGYISVPVSIIQRFSSSNPSGDIVTGLYGYGTSGIMSLFLLIIFFSELCQRLAQGKRIFGWYFLFFVPLGLNETKIVFVMIPIMFVITLWMTKKFTLTNVLFMVFSAAILLYGTSFMYRQVYHREVSEIFSREYLTEYMTEVNSEDIGRYNKTMIAYDIIDRSPLTRTFGYGIGAGFSGQLTGAFGIVSEKYYARNLFGGTRPQLFNTLIDSGVAGVAAQLLFIVLMTVKIVYFSGAYSLKHYVAIFSLLTLFTGIFYQDVMTTPNLAFFIFTSIYLVCIKAPGTEREFS
ncbi:hypothetical protein [Dehalobacterium formicoaceticum]|uniref:O-antigen polymerase n=1 Tax=Dehalobacterium formicoaceticum TaxID=51515 RepID=A0ABT1Y2Z2_9FIRM|nr:hypothetical protein [Dehalobacterium formicoaceticum]MCR6545237.1 hypothetical protein [Dehalobacterium formicoaceticum]